MAVVPDRVSGFPAGSYRGFHPPNAAGKVQFQQTASMNAGRPARLTAIAARTLEVRLGVDKGIDCGETCMLDVDPALLVTASARAPESPPLSGLARPTAPLVH
jgi:hypothetical protein